MGAPGRLVSSLAINAPDGSSLTVAGTELPLRAGEWVTFDDSFFSSASNPSSTECLIALEIACWHPDLLARGRAKPHGRRRRGGNALFHDAEDAPQPDEL